MMVGGEALWRGENWKITKEPWSSLSRSRARICWGAAGKIATRFPGAWPYPSWPVALTVRDAECQRCNTRSLAPMRCYLSDCQGLLAEAGPSGIIDCFDVFYSVLQSVTPWTTCASIFFMNYNNWSHLILLCCPTAGSPAWTWPWESTTWTLAWKVGLTRDLTSKRLLVEGVSCWPGNTNVILLYIFVSLGTHLV